MGNREYLGKGWRYPVSINLTGGVSRSEYEESVRESIFIILGTAPGERLMRPEFGCRIHDLMFAPCNGVTSSRASFYVEEALYKFEPRIASFDVKATPSEDHPNRLDIQINYTLIETHEERSLVYPFYLRSPDEDAGE